jgi:signal peptidase I
MIPVVWVETLRSFGFNSSRDTALVLLTGGLYTATKNYGDTLNHIKDRSLKPRTAFGEWISSVLFAVVAATLVHTYFMQPYIIPTGSLEKTLLIGDFLFVSKFHFGSRVPTTAVSFPMVHDTIPVLKIRSYLKKPQLPFMRLPGLQKVERNEIVVFSWPADTVRQFFVKEAGVRKPIDKNQIM